MWGFIHDFFSGGGGGGGGGSWGQAMVFHVIS